MLYVHTHCLISLLNSSTHLLLHLPCTSHLPLPLQPDHLSSFSSILRHHSKFSSSSSPSSVSLVSISFSAFFSSLLALLRVSTMCDTYFHAHGRLLARLFPLHLPTVSDLRMYRQRSPSRFRSVSVRYNRQHRKCQFRSLSPSPGMMHKQADTDPDAHGRKERKF